MYPPRGRTDAPRVRLEFQVESKAADLPRHFSPDDRANREDIRQCCALILSNKKMMQAHVDGARVGQSATQKWAHEVNLWRVALICRP